MEPITDIFLWEEYQKSQKILQSKREKLEEDNKLLLDVIENSVKDAKITNPNGPESFRDRLKLLIQSRPQGPFPWIIHVKCKSDYQTTQYQFPVLMEHSHRDDFMKNLIDKYHSDTLQQLFGRYGTFSTNLSFSEPNDYVTLLVTFYKPTGINYDFIFGRKF